MEHGGDAFTLWARKRDLTVEINHILYQLIIGVSFFWWLFHNREYRPTSGGSVVVDFLFIVTPIVGVCNCSMFCYTLLYVHSSIEIILTGESELVALLNLSSRCLVLVEWHFLAVPWGCLQFMIVVFSDHTHLLFFPCTEAFQDNMAMV